MGEWLSRWNSGRKKKKKWRGDIRWRKLETLSCIWGYEERWRGPKMKQSWMGVCVCVGGGRIFRRQWWCRPSVGQRHESQWQNCSTGLWGSKWTSEFHSEGHQMSQEKETWFSFDDPSELFKCRFQHNIPLLCPNIPYPIMPNDRSYEVYAIPQAIQGRRLAIMVARISSALIRNDCGRGGLRMGGVSGW